MVFKHALKNVPDVTFACILHEAAVRVMGSAANALERLMEQEYGSDVRLREYLVRLRVQLVLEAHPDNCNADEDNAVLTTCSRAFATCLDSLQQQLNDSDGATDCDYVTSVILRSTLHTVSDFLAAHATTQSGPFKKRTDEGHTSKKRRTIDESAVKLLVADLVGVSGRLLEIQLRAQTGGTLQTTTESRCIEGRVLVRILLESLDQPSACATNITMQAWAEWVRRSGSSLRKLQAGAQTKATKDPSSAPSSSQPNTLTAWTDTVEASRKMLVQLMQLSLIEGTRVKSGVESAATTGQGQGRLTIHDTTTSLFLLLEYADLLVMTALGADTVRQALDLLLSLRGFDSSIEGVIKKLVLLKHFPDHGNSSFGRVYYMTQLAQLSTSFSSEITAKGDKHDGFVSSIVSFQGTVTWLLQQVDQRPALFFDVDLTPFYEYSLQYMLLVLGTRSSEASSPADSLRGVAAFAVSVAERAVAKYRDNQNLWRVFQDIERVCGRHSQAQHLQWRSKV